MPCLILLKFSGPPCPLHPSYWDKEATTTPVSMKLGL